MSEIDSPLAQEGKPLPFGGFLIFVCIWFALNIFGFVINAYYIFEYLSLGYLNIFFDSDYRGIENLFHAFDFINSIIDTFFLCCFLYVLRFFLQKKRVFVYYYKNYIICYCIYIFLSLIVYMYLSYLFPDLAREQLDGNWSLVTWQITSSIIISLAMLADILICIYITRSKRCKATFIRR
ncbi:DUF2569 family protein [Microvirga sp. W0021]|uniref:DUF2569 family protein n=1 Tax=Hohaiivirga grylli TaxID=3133970 RepID=A0ABV0BI22_9HYPH